MLPIRFLVVWAQTLRERSRGDDGSPTLETVIIAAALAAVAIAAVALIVSKIMSHASAVQ